MKQKYDRKKEDSRKYVEGDLVWVEGNDIKDGRPTKKLGPKRFGPFPVIKKVGESAYELLIPTTWKRIHPVFNEVKLTPYTRSTFENQKEHSISMIPQAEGNEGVQEVERILDSRWKNRVLQYLVKWRGQSNEESTWEDRTNIFEGAPEICKTFHQENPEAPRMPTVKIPARLRGRNPKGGVL
jgi:hypothetical protein